MRKSQRSVSSRGARRGSSSRPDRDVELADRLEPDIRDFWNPEWEIGRPDWSLPFDAGDVLVEGVDTERRVVERAMDMSDVVRRIERRFDRTQQIQGVKSLFYLD